MARTIKLSDELYEKVMEKKLPQETQIEFTNKIFLFWLEHHRDTDMSSKAEKDFHGNLPENFKKKFEYLLEDVNEILEKVSLNNDKLYGRNGQDIYYQRSENIYEDKSISSETRKKLRQVPGVIPWDELDKKLEEQEIRWQQKQKERGNR